MKQYVILAHTLLPNYKGSAEHVEWQIHTGKGALESARARAKQWASIYRYIQIREIGPDTADISWPYSKETIK